MHQALVSISLDTDKAEKAARVREALSNVLELLEELIPEGRYKSLAITSFEIAAMWATKAISRG